MENCIFCKIIHKQIQSEVLYEDEDLIVFKDVKPSAPIHLLIVPKKHIASVNDIVEDDVNMVGRIVYRAKKMAEEQGVAQKGYKLIFNCGKEGGQVIDHIHLHLLGGKKLGNVT